MKIVYLPSSEPDFRWFKRYYTNVFPEGKSKADSQFLSVQKTLKENPHIGRASNIVVGARELYIPRTPFSFVYQIRDDRIEVLRVMDNRSNWGGSEE